jgi:RNA polymerase sigma-70 factor (ECF subfamily)
MPDATFLDLIRRVRAGDQEAAAELVRNYEPAIRRTVRIRLKDNRLRRQFDSMDVCQSVLASFFVRAALGQFDLERSEQLLALLAALVRNKVAARAAHEGAGKRDYRRAGAGLDAAAGVPVSAPAPGGRLETQDLLEEARRRLTEEERRLLDLRASDLEWADIAAQLGGTPEALRKKLARAVNRVAEELGLEEVGDV